MSVLLISKDLFFAPVVKSAADPMGVSVTIGLNHDSKKVLDLPSDAISICIVDLSGIGKGDIELVAKELMQRFPAARLVGFAPHVHVAKLQAASECGFDPVLSRGQVSSLLPKLFAQWLGSTSE